MGETRVNLLHLLEDLRDAYPGPLEETILTEIVANALDSGATEIALSIDPAAATFMAVDNGEGMARRQVARYHDLATTTKVRGQGIGFAGVGIKLGLLVCAEVVTESRRGASHVATSWRLGSRQRAPWRWVPPGGWVAGRGTAVCLSLANPLSPLLDRGFLETAIRQHFEPLLDPAFDAVLRRRYPSAVRFVVQGHTLSRRVSSVEGERSPIQLRVGRQRRPSAEGWLVRAAAPLPLEQRGIAVSTMGKVIRRGWDWVGLTPAEPDRVSGLIEVPALAESLTLNKSDFIRTGPRGAVYLAYRKAVQEAVAARFAAWGEQAQAPDEARRRRARPLERDLQSLLTDLADAFPLLTSLVERRPGGQRRLQLGDAGGRGPALPVAMTLMGETDGAAVVGSAPAGDTPSADTEVPEESPQPESREEPPSAHVDAALPGRKRGARKPVRYGLTIQFEARPDTDELARLVESVVWVNESHPAYRRAAASRSEGYHLALSVAMALAPLAVEPAEGQRFIMAFLTAWGKAGGAGRG